MKEETGVFAGSDGGDRFFRIWESEEKQGPLQGLTLILSHGYAEHSGRYTKLAEAVCKQGGRLAAVDHYGHGKSAGKRALIPRFELFSDDLLLFVRSIKAQKKVLLGHSMGGAIASLFTCRHQGEIDGLILSGPAIRNEGGASVPLRLLAGFIGALFPSLPVQKFDSNAVSRDPAVVQDYEEDPLNYTGAMKARTGKELLRLSSLVSEQEIAQWKLPLLLLHGGSDRLVDPACSRLIANTCGSEDITLQIFENLYHEILNEPEQEHVRTVILSWLEERFSAESSS